MDLTVKDFLLKLHKKGQEDTIFQLSDEDDANPVQYFGYLNEEGTWIIQKYDTTTNPKTMRWAAGKTDYATAWTNRAAITSYDYFHLITV